MKNFFKQWYLIHKDYVIRPYANAILSHTLPKMFVNKYNADLEIKLSDPVVLAACPNAGKTLMSIAWIDKYVIDNPTHRVLVLTHGQNILKDQFVKEIDSANVGFTYTKVRNSDDFLNSKSQVVITIPQNVYKVVNGFNFDLLVVDEAHHFYFGTMVQRIINVVNPTRQLLLTGTPAPFIQRGFKNIIPISLGDLIKNGFSADPIAIVSSATYNITEDDINAEGELKDSVILLKDDTINTLNSLLDKVEKRTNKKGWIDVIGEMGKTMIVAKNIAQAKDIVNYFTENKINCLLSTSQNDITSKEIDKFINTNINILIVVNRGILGFNLPTLINIVDMKCGKNISNLFQLFNRITRIHPDGKQKYFYKLVPVGLEVDYLYQLSASLSLMKMENYIKYNGYNEQDITIPVIKELVEREIKTSNDITKKVSRWAFKPIDYLDIPVSKMWKNNDTYSWNTLKEIHETMLDKRIWKNYTQEENYQFCLNQIKDYYGIV